MKLICIAGARPNFMKIAPIMEAFKAYSQIEPLLVHTGQHYDDAMSDSFFRQLEIPAPAINLEVGNGSRATQTAAIMEAFELICLAENPDAILVVGDVNSTAACSLVANKLGLPLIHVEAGLRSFDMEMPEEVNRVLTDQISDLLFVTEPSGVENLKREGIADRKIFFVGNVMIDTLLKNREKARASTIMAELGLAPREFCTMTLHRPSNVDFPETLSDLLDAIEIIQAESPIIFPIHPRTRKNIDDFDFTPRVKAMTNLRMTGPIGYLDFLQLNANARCVLTDSGGLQEETTALGVPCITLRKNTERPITIDVGTNQLAGIAPAEILAAWDNVKAGNYDNRTVPELWDGHAAERIAAIIAERL